MTGASIKNYELAPIRTNARLAAIARSMLMTGSAHYAGKSSPANRTISADLHETLPESRQVTQGKKRQYEQFQQG